MSYDVGFYVKLLKPEGRWFLAFEPQMCSPTYNYSPIFRTCMDWDYDTDHAYPCDMALKKFQQGITELVNNPEKYRALEPPNGWGSYYGAIQVLKSWCDELLRFCENKEIPLCDVYFSWGDRQWDFKGEI